MLAKPGIPVSGMPGFLLGDAVQVINSAEGRYIVKKSKELDV